MTNEQIMASNGRLSDWLNLARADERAKVEAEFADKVPPVGSGPWAIMQHWAGKTVKHKNGDVWNSTECEFGYALTHTLEGRSGWSIVPDEPKAKAMTFTGGTIVTIDGTDMRCVYKGGEWYAC